MKCFIDSTDSENARYNALQAMYPSIRTVNSESETKVSKGFETYRSLLHGTAEVLKQKDAWSAYSKKSNTNTRNSEYKKKDTLSIDQVSPGTETGNLEEFVSRVTINNNARIGIAEDDPRVVIDDFLRNLRRMNNYISIQCDISLFAFLVGFLSTGNMRKSAYDSYSEIRKSALISDECKSLILCEFNALMKGITYFGEDYMRTQIYKEFHLA